MEAAAKPENFCYVCFGDEGELVQPCLCASQIHLLCLERLVAHSRSSVCGVCLNPLVVGGRGADGNSGDGGGGGDGGDGGDGDACGSYTESIMLLLTFLAAAIVSGSAFVYAVVTRSTLDDEAGLLPLLIHGCTFLFCISGIFVTALELRKASRSR